MKFLVQILAAVTIFVTGAQAAATDKIILSPKNAINVQGEVNTTSVTRWQLEIVKKVAIRGTKKYPIYLVLDTPGGSVEDGIDFIQFAKTIRDLHTITIFAASMGSAIVEGLPGKRYITESGWLMFHRAAGQFSGQFEIGEVESRLDMAKKLVLRMERTNAARLGMTLEQYKAKAVFEYWLDSDDSIAAHAADKIIDIHCTPDLIEQRNLLTVLSFFGRDNYSFSGCPLFRGSVK